MYFEARRSTLTTLRAYFASFAIFCSSHCVTPVVSESRAGDPRPARLETCRPLPFSPPPLPHLFPLKTMAHLNDNFLKLKAGYLFPEIARRVNAFCEADDAGKARLIRCGIGDVTEALPKSVTAALHKAVDEMADRGSFKGYGPEQGYAFLREAIAKNDFADKGLEVHADEIFVSDGSKCDCGSILDILGHDNRIGVSAPVYPVYVDTNVMAGHTGDANEAGAYAGITYLVCNEANGFVPSPPTDGTKLDVV